MEFDKQRYKAWKLPHPMLLLWIVNPAAAFNELILGQRIPSVTLIDKASDAPLMERQRVPCPECGALNDGRIWSRRNAFGHWFGLVCPQCHGKIPCLWNMASLLVLGLTFPIWIWFRAFAEKKWMEREICRLSRIDTGDFPKPKNIKWIRMGIIYGVIMFSVMSLTEVLHNHLSPRGIAVQAAIWLGAGLLFGFTMKLVLNLVSRSKR